MAVAVPQPTAPPVEQASKKSPLGRRDRLFAWFWVGPAIIFAAVFLLYPVLNTIWTSFQNANSTKFVGFKNYQLIFTDPTLLQRSEEHTSEFQSHSFI